MAAQEPWIHSGWMSKQGHKLSTWKNRYFVLTATTLYYYKEEVPEGSLATASEALAGQLPLDGAKVYPTMWAPEGAFGWMVATAEGVKYPLRCFGFRDRESWLRKVTSLAAVASTEEKLNESSRGIMGNFADFGSRASGTLFGGQAGDPATRRSSATARAGGGMAGGGGSMAGGGGGGGGSGMAANALAAAQAAELEAFLAMTCGGLKHLAARFQACGVASVAQLCAELNSPAITDAVLHAPPLGMSPGEVNKLRAACDAEAKKPDAEMRAFLARLGLGDQLLAALEAFGVAKVDDLLDPRVVSDADLADLGLASDQVLRFRAAAQHAEQQRAHAAHAAHVPGGGLPGGRLILRLAGPDGFGGEDDEEGLQTMEGFFTLRNDVIVDAHAQLGMPYIGKHGKRHPIFDLVLVGEKQTTRVRSYRFRTLRVFQEEQVANEPGFYTQRLGGAFPGTLTKSKFGLALSEAELAARVVQLSKWAAELLRVRSAMSPRLRRATLSLLQVDEAQLFPEALTLGRVDQGVGHRGQPTETVDLRLTKGFSGLGLDLLPLPDGSIVATVVRPYDFGPSAALSAEPGLRHPADGATPTPLVDGDVLVAVGGVAVGRDFDACKKLLRDAPTTFTVTVRRHVAAAAALDASGDRSGDRSGSVRSGGGAADDGPLAVGVCVGDWNVALGAASVFVAAHLVEVSGSDGASYGLLLVLLRPTDKLRCALCVPPSALRQAREAAPSLAALAASRAHALQLAKQLAMHLVDRPYDNGAPPGPGYVLALEGAGPLASSAAVELADAPSVCLQRALAARPAAFTQPPPAPAAALAKPAAVATTPTVAAAAVSPADHLALRYTVEVDGVGAVSGVPPWALRAPGSAQLLLKPAAVGDRLEMDLNGAWTAATVTAANAVAPSAVAAVAAAYQAQDVAEDSDDDDAQEGSGGGEAADDSAESSGVGSGGSIEGLGEAELSALVNDQVGGLLSFEEFKDSLIRGIQVVKFNRRGAAAFRTLTLIGDHTLTWTAAGQGDAKLKAKGDFDLRELKGVRRGEDADPSSGQPGATGTDVLRRYAAKNADGADMMATGHCLSLLFKDRSVDVGTDSTAHRDFLLNGFRLLGSRGPSGGRLVALELKGRSAAVGFEVKAEVKSSGVVQQVVAVATIVAGSEAAKAGLLVGDRLYAINGQEQPRWLSAKVPADKVAKLVQHKLKRLSSAKASYAIVVERLNLAEHAADLKVAKERAFVGWLESAGLAKFALKLVQAGVKDVETLKYNLDAHKAVLTSAKVGMRKADFKKLLAALEDWADATAGDHGGFALGDKVTWKGEDADLPRGTTGTVQVLHGDGDVEAVFEVRGEAQTFTFATHRLSKVVGSGPSGSNNFGASSSGSAVVSRMLSTRRGSMEPGTLDGGSRAGVSFGLLGPCGGRLVSVALEGKALGLVLGDVGGTSDATGKPLKAGVLVVDMAAESEAAKKGVLLGDRIHVVNGATMPLSYGVKTVKARVAAAKRPLHLILERLQQEPGYVSPSAAVMAEAAVAAASEEQADALLALKGAIFAGGASGGSSVASSCPWPQGDGTAAPFAQWKGLKFEKQTSGLVALTELDMSYFDLSLDLRELRPLLLACPHLKELRLNGNGRLTGDLALLAGDDDGSSGSLTAGDKVLPKLKTLALSNCLGLTGETASLHSLSELVTLNLDNCCHVRGDPKAIKAACPKLVVCSTIGIAP